MNQIPVNQQRSILLRTVSNTELIYCLKLIQKDRNTDVERTTLIFPQMEYDITFFDPTLSKMYCITALVDDVYEDQIKIKYLKDICHKKDKDIANAYGMPNCSCVLNPPNLSKYEGPITLFIPITNIVNICYRFTHNDHYKPEVRVMLLGISATTIKAIIIRMAFFEDCLEEAVKLVDLKAGNIYDLTYESNDGAIYESRVKVINIEECDCTPCDPGKGFVREIVGSSNAVYTVSKHLLSKDEFMSSPPVKKIRIIVDTSESFTGRYEAIMLDSIRDCTLVFESDDDSGSCTDDDFCSCCEHKTDCCDIHHCGHYFPHIHHNHDHHMQTYVYKYDENGSRYKAIIQGDKVSITANNNTTDINLEDLVKYYIGVG